MGRGRQKAKATKQARDMKYFSPATDYSALQRELTDQESRAAARRPESFEPEEPDYSAYADKYGDDDDGEESGARRTG
ncbi:DUF3073 domain-containing protein [Arthrobacter echini]|uniref:DUF3073 domain-containing protein n=1 Tax=Arthrobacter echini TaxID=1529066 RepID=A0A5D0XU63_9MICC|nr:DUF3073 domain-containing protein [Arthrobacter echini]TYD00264.1 DUF3073 domain-containing protein [Arthrobacter echini]